MGELKKFTGIIIVIIFGIISIPFFVKGKKQAKEEFKSLEFCGEISEKVMNLKGQKGKFFIIDTIWYHVIDYQLEKNIQLGDSICKKRGRDEICIVKKNTSIKIKNITYLKVESNSRVLTSIHLNLFEN